MFIATMYSYGWDPQSVGVDGIVTCMGVFLRYEKDLYGIHVPFNSDDINKAGGVAFVNYVKSATKGGAFIGGLKNAELIAVVNGKVRGDVTNEIKAYCKGLGTSARIYQINKNLGANLFSPVATTVVWEQISKRNCVLKYRIHATTPWQPLVGRARVGFYNGNASFTDVLSTNPSGPGWHIVDDTNANITEVMA